VGTDIPRKRAKKFGQLNSQSDTGPEVSVNPGRRGVQALDFHGRKENPPNMPEYRGLFDETISQRGQITPELDKVVHAIVAADKRVTRLS
jgi:hypothetical protein